MGDTEDRSLPAAVLWDMDGTLVDTEPYWMECEFALAEKYGGTWSHEHGLAIVGGDLPSIDKEYLAKKALHGEEAATAE